MTPDEFPQAFINRLRTILGDEWNDFVLAHRQPAPVTIRMNPAKSNILLDVDSVPWCSFGKYLPDRPSFTLDPSFHAGAYYVQEASSMFLEQIFIQTIGNTSSLNVLDLSAAPGGKSTHLLSLMNRDSLLISNEVIQSRASVLSENIQKWGYPNVVVTNNDPRHFSRLQGFFDVVVVDAPCSGEGLFRKDPQAAHEWSEENVDLCSKRQRRILSDVWPALKAGGVLIYSTCTYNEKENEDNLQWLAGQEGAEFIKIDIDQRWGIVEIQQGPVVAYRMLPHRVKGEGFFIAALRKTADQPEGRLKKGKLTTVSKNLRAQLCDWTQDSDNKVFVERNGLVQFFPHWKVEEINHVVNELHIISAGTVMASIKHTKLVPEHPLALSTEVNKNAFKHLPVEKENALRYLRKDPIEITHSARGFALVTFEETSLGWVNMLDNRINNLYPSQWRIRMR